MGDRKDALVRLVTYCTIVLSPVSSCWAGVLEFAVQTLDDIRDAYRDLSDQEGELLANMVLGRDSGGSLERLRELEIERQRLRDQYQNLVRNQHINYGELA